MARFRTDKDQLILDCCRGKKVLDVGCVNHTLEATLRDDWKHAKIKTAARELIGLDYEAEVVGELNKRGWNILVGDAQNFDITKDHPGGFDVIVASDVIEHLVNPGGFLVCCRKHLAPGGVLIITTPHAYGLTFFLEVLVTGEEHINDDHTMTFSRKNLLHLLDRCGLRARQFIWLSQDSTCLQKGLAAKIAAKTLFILQCIGGFLQVGLSKEMIVLAEDKGAT